jgi:ribonuclease HI
MSNTAKHVIITSDGACHGNGKEDNRAAAAAILNYKNLHRAVACYIGKSTNQRAEIIAAALALESLREPCQVTLRTDSRYVVNTMNGEFKRKSNLDCWARLDAAALPHAVTFEWVKGHNGDPEQEAADRIAQATAALGQVSYEVLNDVADRLNNTSSEAHKRNVIAALRLIASQCDGARKHDGRGFSRFDAEFGHRLAAKNDLSPREVAAAGHFILPYRAQISQLNPQLAAVL